MNTCQECGVARPSVVWADRFGLVLCQSCYRAAVADWERAAFLSGGSGGGFSSVSKYAPRRYARGRW